MPKKGAAGSVRTQEAKVKKVVEDRTFGMKNKNKSKKVQAFIKQVEKNATQPFQQVHKGPSVKEQKEAERKAKEEIDSLFKPVIDMRKQTVAPGQDPSTVVCQFFLNGSCKKGAKCKFSHDPALLRRAPKLDIYTDQRDLNQMKMDGDDYDEEELQRAIEEKHGKANLNKPTEIVCKFFVDALEKKQYGYFWECPNGESCKYRHALPPGYVLKRDQPKEAEVENTMSAEEQLEIERAALPPGPLVTLETFLEWKRKMAAEREAERREREDERRRTGVLSGRQLFEQNPDMFQDDVEAMDYEREDNVATDERVYDVSALGRQFVPTDLNDAELAQATERLRVAKALAAVANSNADADDASAAGAAATMESHVIDEALFGGDDDLDDLPDDDDDDDDDDNDDGVGVDDDDDDDDDDA